MRGENIGRSNRDRGNGKGRGNINRDDNEHGELIKHELITGQLKTRSKKGQISINHLLDFSLPEREVVPSKIRTYHKTKKPDNALHLTGMAFVNANYRFIVDPRGDYSSVRLDPNVLIDNELILRVIIRRGNACPICLDDELTAPRMVNCGHCFCYVCLLNFFESGKENLHANGKPKLKDCPLCGIKIKPDSTLPIMVDDTEDELFDTPKADHEVIFKLMKKPSDSILALPVSVDPDFNQLGDIPWCTDKHNQLDSRVFPYARLMRGSLDFIVGQYQNEIESIEKVYMNDIAEYDNSTERFVIQAKSNIENAISQMKARYDGDTRDLDDQIESLKLGRDEGHNYYYYYQAGFNTNVKYILSPLDVKILKSVFIDYSSFPSTLVLPAEHIQLGTLLSDRNISKYKYFAHYPYGVEVGHIEIDWLKKLEGFQLPNPIFQQYKKEILNRNRKNKKKSKLEEDNKIKAMKQLELKTKEFYKTGSHLQTNNNHYNQRTEIPLTTPVPQEENEPDENYSTTVWGTKIKKQKNLDTDYDEDDDLGFDLESLTKQASKKGRKKLVLVSSIRRRG